MHSLRILALIGIGLISTSFMTEEKSTDKLCATWVYSGFEDGCSKFVKSHRFKRKKSGISFNKNGTLKKRQNVGWCGTPPITYKNYDGTWNRISKTRMIVHYEYWGGEISEEWLIEELNDKTLTIRST